MGSATRGGERDVGFVLVLAFALAGCAYVIEGRLGLGLRDEGFLWYGVERTLQGEVPLRDFRSYDPGRYLWCAAWMKVLGEGILALRASTAIFQALGLACGLLAARRVVASRWMLLPIGLLLLLWMVPPWKLFEPSLAMAAVLVGARLLEAPTAGRHFAAGVFIGVAGFLGRNHGLYATLSLGALAILAYARVDRSSAGRKVVALAGGLALGCVPLLAMLLFTPGFREAFWDSVRGYLEQESLNAPLPVPWPWRIPVEGRSLVAIATGWGIGLCFLALPLFLVAALGRTLLARRSTAPGAALLAATAFVGAAYAHHAFVRADFLHLAQAIHPFWIGILAFACILGASRPRALTLLTIGAALALSLAAIGPQRAIARRVFPARPELAFVRAELTGDTLWIDGETARLVDRLSDWITTRVGAGEPVWISSHLVSLHPILGSRSPVWDIYPAWKASEAYQDRMLGELADVHWAILADEPVHNPTLALSNTYPRVWRMLAENFEVVPVDDLPSRIHILRRRGR